jgi:hypothetical protein
VDKIEAVKSGPEVRVNDRGSGQQVTLQATVVGVVKRTLDCPKDMGVSVWVTVGHLQDGAARRSDGEDNTCWTVNYSLTVFVKFIAHTSGHLERMDLTNGWSDLMLMDMRESMRTRQR